MWRLCRDIRYMRCNAEKRTHITRIQRHNCGRPSHPTPQRKIHQIFHHGRFPRIRRSKHHQPRPCLIFSLRISPAVDVWRLSTSPARADGPACEYAPAFECEMEVGQEGQGG